MSHKTSKQVLYFILFSLFLLFTQNLKANDRIPIVEKGTINLSEYNFEQQENVRLTGDWAFYSSRFLDLEQIKSDTNFCYVKVPKSLGGQDCKGKELSKIGFGTYHLKIILNKNCKNKIFLLKTKSISTASKIYVNGKLVGSGGNIVKTKEDSNPSLSLHLDEFTAFSDTLNIVIQLSNHHIRKFGLQYDIELGIANAINKETVVRASKDLFVIGSIFLMMLYYFVLFYLRKKDKSSLYFAVTCFAFAFYSLTLSTVYFYFMPDFGFETHFKLKRIALYLSLATMALFIFNVFKREFPKLALKIIVGTSLAFILGTAILNTTINSPFIIYFRYFGLLTTVYLIYIVIRAIFNKRKGGYIFIIGFAIMFATIVNDFLHNTQVINTTDLMPFGMFLFLFMQAYYLSAKVNKTFTKSEELTEELKYINKNLEKIVDERTAEIRLQKEEIEVQKDEIISSITYAKRIQQAVLPSEEYTKEILPEHFIFFKPKDIVSGDFYWIKKIKNFIVVAAADSTGHGVPGAFMSMLGSSFLNEIVTTRHLDNSGEILNKMRAKVKKALKQDGSDHEAQDGMDIAFYVINIETLEVQFSGAYNPLYIIRNKETIDEKSILDTGNFKIYSHPETINHSIIEVKANRQPIAIYVKEKEFETQRFQLQKGDCLYTFSDGFSDQFGGEAGDKYKTKNFKNLLLQHSEKSMIKQKGILAQEFNDWRGKWEQIDDVLVIGIRI